VSGVSAPILIGLPCADPLDPPYALDPLNTAVNIATAPTAAINLYRFTTSLLPSCLQRPGLPISSAIDTPDDAKL
jgi:hypothetical protein